MAVFLEIMRYNYALNVGVQAGTFKPRGDNFDWVSGPRTGHQGSFEDILMDLWATMQLTGWRNAFKDWRNDVVHQGSLRGSADDQRRHYLDMHHFCDRVLLALLDWDHAGGDYIPINDHPHPDPKAVGYNWQKFQR
jgi:hypothetical protein